jgi:hypothetical protein
VTWSTTVDITLDRQTVSQSCRACAIDVVVIRGSVYDGGQPIGLYLIALHGHSPSGRLAHLALAFVDPSGSGPPTAAAIEVTATPEQFGYSLVDWSESPWKHESYLGEMLDRQAALASPLKGTLLHVAGHITRDIPEVRHYFA